MISRRSEILIALGLNGWSPFKWKDFTVRKSLKKIYYCILFSRRQESSWKQHRGFITSFAPDQLSSFACVDNFAHLVWLFGGTFFLERISDQILVVTSPHLWKPVDPPPSLKVLNKWNLWQPISVPLKLLACLWVSLRFISVMLVLFLTVYFLENLFALMVNFHLFMHYKTFA